MANSMAVLYLILVRYFLMLMFKLFRVKYCSISPSHISLKVLAIMDASLNSVYCVSIWKALLSM